MKFALLSQLFTLYVQLIIKFRIFSQLLYFLKLNLKVKKKKKIKETRKKKSPRIQFLSHPQYRYFILFSTISPFSPPPSHIFIILLLYNGTNYTTPNKTLVKSRYSRFSRVSIINSRRGYSKFHKTLIRSAMNDAIYTHPLNYHNAWQRADITHPRPLIFDLEPTDTGMLEESRVYFTLWAMHRLPPLCLYPTTTPQQR